MNNVDKQYKQLLKFILDNGRLKKDRTGTGTISIFDYSIRFKMSEGFPLLTSKKMFTKGVIHELIWFLKGDTNIKYLVDNDVHIWDGDAYKSFCNERLKIHEKIVKENPTCDFQPWEETISKEEFINKIKTDEQFALKWGNMGPIYGMQWRHFGGKQRSTKVNDSAEPIEWKNVDGVDQISDVINLLKNDPDSRRIILNSWNVTDLPKMKLPPCHYGFQCYTYQMDLEERTIEYCKMVGKDISFGEDLTHAFLDGENFPQRKLSLKWIQRSVDTFLGLPFNIASYGLLLHLLSKEVNMIPDELIFSGGDVHLYTNHIEQAKEQINRGEFNLPTITLNNNSIFDLQYDDIKIENYQSCGSLKAELSN